MALRGDDAGNVVRAWHDFYFILVLFVCWLAVPPLGGRSGRLLLRPESDGAVVVGNASECSERPWLAVLSVQRRLAKREESRTETRRERKRRIRRDAPGNIFLKGRGRNTFRYYFVCVCKYINKLSYF